MPSHVNTSSEKEIFEHSDTTAVDIETDDVEDDAQLTKAEKRKILMKMGFRIIGFLSIIFGISIIDRINIGSAKVMGMKLDLGIDIGSR
jgi:hypothetical protein